MGLAEWAAVALLLALDRETATIIALGVLAGASLMVSIGAWILLLRERRSRRPGRE